MDEVKQLRNQIDEIDNKLLDLLQKRFEVADAIGIAKEKVGMPSFDETRWQEILQLVKNKAEEKGLNAEFIEKVWNNIHEEVLQRRIKN